jgi:Fur family ferric uptake transcriptional regulator
MASATARSNQDALRNEIRGRGLRATPSRVQVLTLLRASETPLSHGDVADRLDDNASDRATVYRNLIDLAEVGLLRRIDLGDHTWRFEAVDPAHGGDQHPHFVCSECGVVECLPELELSARQGRTPRALRRSNLEVQVRGLCDTCV